MIVEFNGIFSILFIGKTDYSHVTITGVIQDGYGRFLYLTGPDDTIYNWDNIIIMKRVK